ncbi:MAG: gliding motility-associated C-terminal domain-containing protein [Flavobacteriales bacterium]|nr:gliding motility-associated C-terminal domain-containing protein [Flavobacteriales bacterium]
MEVTVVANPDAGTPGAITLCTSNAATDLFAQLGGTPDAGGSWSGPSTLNGSSFDPGTMLAGVYTYTITVPPPCTSASSAVTVALSTPPDPGVDGALLLCATSPATALIGGLGGSPDAGGVWSGPSPVVGGLFDPAGMAPGTYTYTVAGTPPCPAAAAIVEVTVVANPDAGTPGAITLCTSNAATDLFAQLGGTPDAGGTWSGPSTLNGSSFDPGTMLAGVYTYSISVPPPCMSASSAVTVALSTPPDPGTGGALLLCATSPATALIGGLGGSPDAGGVWSGPSPVVGGLFDPAGMAPGTYTYSVAGTAPCPAAAALVEVTVVANPDAGTPGAITQCTTDAAVDLFAQLGGTPDAGGTWSGPSALNGSSFDPGTMFAGVYTYTITVPPPCSSASSTVTVTLSTPPDPGVDGALLLCATSPAAALLSGLGGSPDAGGVWSGPSPVIGGLFDPVGMAPGTYTYTVAGTAPCPAAAAIVEVTVVANPDAGTPGAITLCTSNAATDLFAQLGGTPDAGGSWSGPSTLNGSSFDPGTMLAGVYTYTITVPPPCSSASSTVTVTLSTPPDPGSDGVLTVCAVSGPASLITALGGTPDAGGLWTDPNGDPHNGLFDPLVDPVGIYTYTVVGQAPCPALSASATVQVQAAPSAGTPAVLNLCASGSPVDLLPVLGGADPGGTWTDPNGDPFTGPFDPTADPAGLYTYTVAGTAPCPSASATITVQLLTDPDAGADATLTLCSTGAVVDLFSQLGGTPDAGGQWLDPNGQPVTASFDPASGAVGNYTYVLVVPAPCVNDTAHVMVSVIPAVDAGLDGALLLCATDAPVPLFGQLGGTPDAGGLWMDPQNQPWTGPFDPSLHPAGTYTYQVDGTAPCPDDAATVVVAVEALPDAGVDGSTTVCPEAAPVNLFTLLGGTPDAGGAWTDPNGWPSNGVFDPGTDPQGGYTYTVLGQGACPNASASATLSIFLLAPPDAGPDLVVCDLMAPLNATGTWSSGHWIAGDSAEVLDAFAPFTMAKAPGSGAYSFIWSVLSTDGCAMADTVVITFTTPITAVEQTTDAICHGACDGSVQVDAAGGNGAFTFQWSPLVNATSTATACSAQGLCAGLYTVTVLDTNACSAQLTFPIGEPPPLVIDAIATTPETCPGTCDGTLQVVDPEGVLYSFDGGTTWLPDPISIALCSGPYTVLMMNAVGCLAASPAMLIPPAPVVADFVAQPDTVLVSDPTVIFTNESDNASWFTWDFAGSGTSTLHDPSFTFPDVLGGTYTVCLTAVNGNGCVDSICHPVVVLDLLAVHVPNAFTPNADGINDHFMPVFNEPSLLTEYTFMIFDRWGELIWESVVPHEPWTGDYNGIPVQQEVYTWRLIYKDGRSFKKEAVMGHVTVLR